MAICGQCQGSGVLPVDYPPCPRCKGRAGRAANNRVHCTTCGGSGKASARQNDVCWNCNGVGKVADPPPRENAQHQPAAQPVSAPPPPGRVKGTVTSVATSLLALGAAFLAARIAQHLLPGIPLAGSVAAAVFAIAAFLLPSTALPVAAVLCSIVIAQDLVDFDRLTRDVRTAMVSLLTPTSPPQDEAPQDAKPTPEESLEDYAWFEDMALSDEALAYESAAENVFDELSRPRSAVAIEGICVEITTDRTVRGVLSRKGYADAMIWEITPGEAGLLWEAIPPELAEEAEVTVRLDVTNMSFHFLSTGSYATEASGAMLTDADVICGPGGLPQYRIDPDGESFSVVQLR